MISLGPAVRVLVATKPVDFRKGADGLAALAKEALGQDPFSGHLFAFRGRKADMIKLLYWDGTGLCLFTNYLASHCSSFRWRLAS